MALRQLLSRIPAPSSATRKHRGAAGLTLQLLSQVNLLSVTVPLTCAEMTDLEMARCPPDALCMLIKLTIASLP